MKKVEKIVILLLVFFGIITPTYAKQAVITHPNATQTQKWEISLQEWNCSGTFDYLLYYQNSSQIMSLVILPQTQWVTSLDLGYRFGKDDKNRFKLKIGKTDANVKGRGSDSDWTDSDALNQRTYYGEMDVYGRQQWLTVLYERTLFTNRFQNFRISGGWGRRETANELKNVVYHLVNGINVENQSQADNGSTLHGEFSGFWIGIGDDIKLNKQWDLCIDVEASLLTSKANGHWANHLPAWDWVDEGDAKGYMASIGLKYTFTPKLRLGLEYCYNHIKADVCREILNNAEIAEPVGLRYEQKRLCMSMDVLF